jgi:alpha-tubulin suppressor-like RCC1 family protein
MSDSLDDESSESSWESGSDGTPEGAVVDEPNPLHRASTGAPSPRSLAAGQRPITDRSPGGGGGDQAARTAATRLTLIAFGIFLLPVGIMALIATLLLAPAEHQPDYGQTDVQQMPIDERQHWTDTDTHLSVADSNCSGTWSSCSVSCRRTWRERVPQLGSGKPCPMPDDCMPGDDECPHTRIDCEGAWSACNHDCRREWIGVRSPAFGGVECPPEPSCASGENFCPIDVDCVVQWSVCSATCETSSERNGTVIVQAARHGKPCSTMPPDCATGEDQCGRFPFRPRSVWMIGADTEDAALNTGNSVQRVANLGDDNVAAAVGGGDTNGRQRDRTDSGRVLPESPSFSLILKADGRVYTLGSPLPMDPTADTDQLDQSAFSPAPVEVQVHISGSDARVRAVEAGAHHCMVLTHGDDVLTWGHGERGQLGHGSFQSEGVPRLVVATRNGATVYGWRRSWIVGISAGGFHSAALTMEGRLYMWGGGSYFQLGTGSARDENHPIEIMSVGTGNLQVTLGRFHSLLLTGAGAVLAWGRDVEHQCGTGPHSTNGEIGQVIDSQPGSNQVYCSGTVCAVMRPALVRVQSRGGVVFNSSQIAVARDSSFALTSHGQLFAWGANYQGQLGDGTRTVRSTPISVAGYPVDTRQQLPTGGSQANHMLVKQHDGTFIGSGQGSEGQLGPDLLVSWTDAEGVIHRPSGSTLAARPLPSLGADNAQAARGWHDTVLVKS